MCILGPRRFHCVKCEWKGFILYGDLIASNSDETAVGVNCPLCYSGVKFFDGDRQGILLTPI